MKNFFINKSDSALSGADFEKQFIEQKSQLEAIQKSQAYIEFELDGTIITANEAFQNTMGYSLVEIQGKHHSMFAEPELAASAEYRQFWETLNRGEFMSGEFLRIAKSGKEVWLQATYNPLFDEDGKPYKVVKYASDITNQKLESINTSGQIEAINKSQAVIEFEPDGTILDANENFLNAVGYSLNEIQGKHHSMFVDKEYSASDEYLQFWKKLGNGSFESGEYQRFAKGHRELWLQASYNPIFDFKGRVIKVVKFASDITAAKKTQQDIESVLTEVSDVMSSLSSGSLMNRVKGEFSGEFSKLKDVINNYIDTLIKKVTIIKNSSLVVGTASKEISEGNHNLSQRTEQQAASLEETSSSMEEMTSTVQQNADNAQQANQLAIDARQQAENGGTVVATAVAAMNEINSSSKKIADITSVIDEIAFQTNLLALNASVEAARAGEQGRGFAVVASEVRNLAGRSATAAKEIKELIEDSVSKVDEGSKLVNKSGETLNEIVTSVKKVTDIIGEISASSQEQASGIDEINRSVLLMDEGTQQNAALVEEAAAASQSMRQEADELTKQMSFFVVDDEDMDTSIQVQETVQVERPISRSSLESNQSRTRVNTTRSTCRNAKSIRK